MSTHSNPFAQGGWYNASFVDHRNDQTSVYGALPMTTGPENGNAGGRGPTHFQFSNPNPNILNSSIVGSGSRELIRVSTDERLSGYTAFRDAEGRSIALIEWASRPAVEVRGAVPKGSAGEWLKVVQDPVFGRLVLQGIDLDNALPFSRPVRRMEVRGAKFIWCPNGDALLVGRSS